MKGLFSQNITQGPGTETFTSHTLEIIIMLLGAFFLGWLLRHLWKIGKSSKEYEEELSRWKEKYNQLGGEYNDLVGKYDNLKMVNSSTKNFEDENFTLRGRISQLEKEVYELRLKPIPEDLSEELADTKRKLEACQLKLITKDEHPVKLTTANESAVTSLVEKAPIKPPVEIVIPIVDEDKIDNLKAIEGIGPKIASILNDKGIKSFKALSLTSVEVLRAILDEEGDHYAIHDPKTWPEQARLAYEEKWETLKEWQKELKGGKLKK
ncbi:MAG: hypothetical protein K1X55_05520 [Chitinophagales bacterium]|nr:hypothetical protein [Chitinophagales bacterium]